MVFVKRLGEGSQGTVNLYNHTHYNSKVSYVAVKTSDDLNADSLQAEIEILSKLKDSPGIVQVYGDKILQSFDDKGNKIHKMFMEYAPGGSLITLINTFPHKKLPDSMIREFTCMLLEGLAAIHDLGYVHCDLKPENILVFPSKTSNCGYELKISDLGASVREGDDSWWFPGHPYAGTPIYMSPESVVYGETGEALDLWSLGCVVLEMYTGKQPWKHTNYDLEDLNKFHTPLIPNDLPMDAEYFINTCFSLDTEERGDALRLMDHMYLRGYTNQKKLKSDKKKAKKPKKQRRCSFLNGFFQGILHFTWC